MKCLAVLSAGLAGLVRAAPFVTKVEPECMKPFLQDVSNGTAYHLGGEESGETHFGTTLYCVHRVYVFEGEHFASPEDCLRSRILPAGSEPQTINGVDIAIMPAKQHTTRSEPLKPFLPDASKGQRFRPGKGKSEEAHFGTILYCVYGVYKSEGEHFASPADCLRSRFLPAGSEPVSFKGVKIPIMSD